MASQRENGLLLLLFILLVWLSYVDNERSVAEIS